MGGATFLKTTLIFLTVVIVYWIGRENSVTTVVSVLLHTKVEVDGIYYTKI